MSAKPIIPILEDKRFRRDPLYNVGLLKFSILAIGNDGGGIHLASMACPVIGLYGPNTPVKWGPLGEKNVIFYKNPGCSPCKYIHMKKPEECKLKRKCLRDITVEEVMGAVNFILENSKCNN